MATVTVSAQYQVEIPLEVRLEIPLEVGQRMTVVTKGGVISLVPEQPLAKLRGIAKGADVNGFRDEQDRL
jgi:bifunctional DNA-binding transcriptional regulator/antitoxin component of YhaV-PrlF toxin-antitoxin module